MLIQQINKTLKTALLASAFCIAQGALAQVNGPFVPPNGQKLMIIGQDTISIDDYRTTVPVEPAGVTSYIALSNLSGLETYVDNGGGPNHAAYLQSAYPNSIHAIAVYIKGAQSQAANGQLDSNMEQIANVLKDWGRPVLLRFGYEADGNWNSNDPGTYIQAFRRMHDKLDQAGADNVAMVWQVAAYCGGTYRGLPFTDWYPGDEYTDWLGFSYFTPQDCGNRAIDAFMNFARSKDKPVMIAESAPQRYDVNEGAYNTSVVRQNPDIAKSGQQIWDEWYANFFNYIRTHEDYIRAVAYINADWDSQSLWAPPYPEGYWGDTRVQTNSVVQTNWVNEITSGDWIQSSDELFDILAGSVVVTPGPTPTSTVSPTPSPTPEPGDVVKMEAESASSFSGDARAVSDSGASGGSVVAYMDVVGEGFTLANVPASHSIIVYYASQMSGTMSMRVNGEEAGKIPFSNTGVWVGNYQAVSVDVDIPDGATFEVYYGNGDAAMNVDYVDFVTNAATPSPSPTPTPTPTPAKGWEDISFEDFEQGFVFWQDGGNDVFLRKNTEHASSGVNAANIQDDSGPKSTIRQLAFDATVYRELEISFWYKPISMERDEFFRIQFQEANGKWANLKDYVKGIDFVKNGNEYSVNLSISSADYDFGSGSRFRVRCFGNTNADDIYIDDILVRGFR